jgi:biotin carboxyl carrier protein
MSSYYVTIGNAEYHVNLAGNQPMVDGKPVPENHQLLCSQGQNLLRHGTQTGLFINSQESDTLEILVGSHRMVARVASRERRLSQRKSVSRNGALTAPMPGLIIKILVIEGQQVEQGQTLVMMESMKMQMQLRSACSGSVRSVNVQPGSQVEKGSLLVLIEPTE